MSLRFLHKEKTLPGLCCLYILPDKLIVTHALHSHQENQKPTITFLETCSYESHLFKSTLEKIIKKHTLEGMACSWVLHNSYYHLFLLEAPSVSASEIPLALRWQIKELIDFPPEDATTQYFPMPSLLEAKKKIYVAAAKTLELQAIADMICEAGLQLKYIDIAELALRNITALYCETQCYLGFLAFNRNYVEFIITFEKEFLLSRRFQLPNTTPINLLPPEWLTNLISEIQNSFVYSKSQYRQELPEKLLVLTTVPELVKQMNQLLNIEAEQFNIANKLNMEFIASDNDFGLLDNLIVIGGALRGE